MKRRRISKKLYWCSYSYCFIRDACKIGLKNSPLADVFFHFPNTHSALNVANSLPFFIENELNPRLLDSTDERITILTDAVPSFQIKAIDLAVIDFSSKQGNNAGG
jgi:hypothetical protein